jgi:hypothetical protein
MLLRVTAAVGIAFVLAAGIYALSGQSSRAVKPNLASAVRVCCLSLGASAWLVLASTALIWLFPLNVVASTVIGFYGTKEARGAFPASEVKAFAFLSFTAGASIAAAIATAGDPFMLQVAAPYSLLNALAMAISSYLALRPTRSEA